jgi:chemotaxis protein CheX
MSRLDADFFKPFVDGTLTMMKVSCSTQAKVLKPFLKGTAVQNTFDIAGVIGLTSKTFSGTITLCFPNSVFLLLMSRMLGETFTEVTPDLQDGAAEFLNMIYGQAKVVLNQNGHSIDKALPTVIRGRDIQTNHAGKSKVMVLPFETEAGNFYIEICSE